MFLDTMSPEAIIKEARRDTTAILNKRDFFINTHRREILFAKKFPVSFQIEWKSPLTHNQWHIIIACNNKKERENPDVYYYSTYETYRGAGIIFPVYNMRTEELVFSRYTGHFFSRYRTRHLVPNNLYTPGMDVIRHYVDHNSSYFYPQTDAENSHAASDGIVSGNLRERSRHFPLSSHTICCSKYKRESSIPASNTNVFSMISSTTNSLPPIKNTTSKEEWEELPDRTRPKYHSTT
ncbi:MAG: hypothetical protein ACLU4N_05965 [Butyricimonas faecihominis]